MAVLAPWKLREQGRGYSIEALHCGHGLDSVILTLSDLLPSVLEFLEMAARSRDSVVLVDVADSNMFYHTCGMTLTDIKTLAESRSLSGSHLCP